MDTAFFSTTLQGAGLYIKADFGYIERPDLKLKRNFVEDMKSVLLIFN